ncbi:unnamed protein product, partial [Acanthocheilonema viteae]
MSSWLTFFRLRKVEGEEGDNSTEEMGATPLNLSILHELDEEQQAHIREVFRRAEQSHKEVRVVLNKRKLSRLSDARFRGIADENEQFFTVRNESFVQMDSLPETIEVREASDSLLNSKCNCSESSTVGSKDTKDSSIEQPGYFTQSIKQLSKQLYRWISSLDDDGGDILTSARKLARFSTPLNIERNTDFAKYVSKMSHEICTLAIADSVCKIVLDQYCHWLCTVIFTAVYNELKLKYGTDAEIDRYCSELTINIFKSVYLNALELLCGQEQPHTTWSGSDHNVHTALLRASSTTFKKSISCECIQSLARLIDQESTLYRYSELDDDCEEEFCYVLLEEDKEKLSQELRSALQNFAEKLWIHILALVLADVMLKKQGSVLQEKFSEANLTSSVQENIQEERQNSFSSIDDYGNLDDSSCSVSSDEFVNEYTLLDNENRGLRLYMKQQVDGKMSPPLTLYEVDPTRDIYLNPLLTDIYETRKQSKPESGGSSGSEFSETEWNTRQQLDSESYHSESSCEEKSTSTATEQLSNNEGTGNTEAMKYIEQIIKEAEYIVSDEATSKTTQNGKIYGQEKNMDNLEIDLISLEEWSSSTLSAMIQHVKSIFDGEVKLGHHIDPDLECLDSRTLNETLKSKNSIYNRKIKENGRKNVLVGEEQSSTCSESLSDLTTEITNNYYEFEEDNIENIPNQIHEPLESRFSTYENRPLNDLRLVPEMESQDYRDESFCRFNNFKDEKFESCSKFDELNNTEEVVTQFSIDKKLTYEDNFGDLFNSDLDERHPIFRKQKSDSISTEKFDETTSITSGFLDETYSDNDIVMKRRKNEDGQSFIVEEQEWSESEKEKSHKKFQIQEMNLMKFEKDEIKSEELPTTEITKLEDQKMHYHDQQKIDGLHTVMSSAVYSKVRTYEVDAKSGAKSSTFQSDTIVSTDSVSTVVSKAAFTTDSLRNENQQMKEKLEYIANVAHPPAECCQDFKSTTIEDAVGNKPEMLTFGLKKTTSDGCDRLNDSAKYILDAMIPRKQLSTKERTEHITNINSAVEKEIDATFEESEFELTQDELEHIARVSCMAEEAFGKLQALQNPQTKLPTDKDLVEDEGRIISDYEEYNVKEAEEFSEQSQSKTSSATSGPDSPQ